MQRRLFLLVVSLLTLALPAYAADQAAERFDIFMNPPEAVGEKWRVTASGTSAHKYITTEDGVRNVSDKRFAIELSGVLTNLEVSKKHLATKISFDVERCVASIDGKPHPLCKKGDVVILTADDKGGGLVTLNGKALAEDDQTLLRIALYVSSPQALTADARFPANGQRKAGDTWKLDPDTDAAGWAQSGVKVRKEDLSGEAKLLSVLHENGVPWLSLQTNYEAKGLEFEDDPQSDSKSEPGSTRMTVKLVVPAALPWKSSQVEVNEDLNIRLKSRVDDGTSYRSETIIRNALKATWERLEAKPEER